MARIDFHSNVADKLLYCCRLSRKIMASAELEGHVRTIVVVGSSNELQELDALMWNFSKTDFLPHAWLNQDAAQETPIVLVSDEHQLQDSTIPHRDVLIYLKKEEPKQFNQLLERFPRWIEVVTTQDDERLAGRERYKAYRELGHELHHFDQGKGI
jgi:DNA polymerase-3 subunit chi